MSSAPGSDRKKRSKRSQGKQSRNTLSRGRLPCIARTARRKWGRGHIENIAGGSSKPPARGAGSGCTSVSSKNMDNGKVSTCRRIIPQPLSSTSQDLKRQLNDGVDRGGGGSSARGLTWQAKLLRIELTSPSTRAATLGGD